MESKQIKNILEAGLLVAGRALSIAQLEALFGDDETKPDRKTLRESLQELQSEYEGRGIELVEIASGFRLQSHHSVSSWVANLFQEKTPRYSRALLETLVLIAYRQPITRAEIEEVRGVAVSSNIIKTLQERRWVKVLGHKEVPGRPALLGTSKEFLDYFNLKKLEDLPSLADIKDLDQFDAILEEEVGLVDGQGQGQAANDEAPRDDDAGDSSNVDSQPNENGQLDEATVDKNLPGYQPTDDPHTQTDAQALNPQNDDHSQDEQDDNASQDDALQGDPESQIDSDVQDADTDAKHTGLSLNQASDISSDNVIELSGLRENNVDSTSPVEPGSTNDRGTSDDQSDASDASDASDIGEGADTKQGGPAEGFGENPTADLSDDSADGSAEHSRQLSDDGNETDSDDLSAHNNTMSGAELDLLRVIENFSDEHQEQMDARSQFEAQHLNTVGKDDTGVDARNSESDGEQAGDLKVSQTGVESGQGSEAELELAEENSAETRNDARSSQILNNGPGNDSEIAADLSQRFSNDENGNGDFPEPGDTLH